jgi:lipid II:glycine glycyltransferase (peptidoglycan interpeptide bridge formation enzyme)
MTRLGEEAGGWSAIEPPDREAWDALCAEAATADPLQSWAWADAGTAVGERWGRLVAMDADGHAHAAVQWQLVSPVLGHPLAYAPHGPVWRRTADAGVPDALVALMAGMRTRCAEAGVSAMLVDPRSGQEGAPGEDPAAVVGALGFETGRRHVQMPSTRVIDLSQGLELAHAGFDKDTRNLIRRSAREGVQVEVAPAADGSAVAELHGLMLDAGSRGGFQPRSAAFLGAYGARAGDRAFVCLGRWQGRVIAGAMVGFVGDRGYYQFAGSLREPELRHANAPYAVMDGVIAACLDRGAASLDLCGVNERDDPDADPRWEGLSSFKRGFGGQPVRHPPVATLVLRPGVERLRVAGQQARQRLSSLRGRA